MKVPKSISPDRIKDALVEIVFDTDYPHEINLGIFFNVLKKDYQYANKPLGSTQVTTNSINYNNELTLSLGGISLFYNDLIKFQISNNSIAFNCRGEYILWENYSKEISNVLEILITTDVIKIFKRIGLRYISEYPNIDLKDSINFNFSFGFPNITSNNYSFTSEFDLNSFRVVLNLKNKIPIIDSGNILEMSYVDIDVIKNIELIVFDDVFKEIQDAHTLEKEIFFKLLKEDFLLNLNPQY